MVWFLIFLELKNYFVGKQRECQSFSGAVLGDDTCCLLVLCSRILFNLRWIWPLTQRQRGANLAASVDGEWQQKQLWANGIVWTPRRNWCFCLLSFSNIIWLLILLWKGIYDLPSPATYVLVDVHVKERNVTVSSAIDIHDIPDPWRLPRILRKSTLDVLQPLAILGKVWRTLQATVWIEFFWGP